jgi:hypothetical protein
MSVVVVKSFAGTTTSTAASMVDGKLSRGNRVFFGQVQDSSHYELAACREVDSIKWAPARYFQRCFTW